MIASLLPENISGNAAFILILVSFFASGLTASAGIGGGLIMLAVMSYVVPIHALIPVHGLVQLGSNTGRTWLQRQQVNIPVTMLFLVGSVLGAGIGAALYIDLDKQLLQLLMGGFILLLVWIRFPPIQSTNPLIVVASGIITTFISMFVGATGPLVALFLSKILSTHKELVATHGAMMSVQHLVKIIAFLFTGFAFTSWLPLAGVIIFSGYFGTKAGTALMHHLPEKTLKILFKSILTIVALDLLRKAVFG